MPDRLLSQQRAVCCALIRVLCWCPASRLTLQLLDTEHSACQHAPVTMVGRQVGCSSTELIVLIHELPNGDTFLTSICQGPCCMVHQQVSPVTVICSIPNCMLRPSRCTSTAVPRVLALEEAPTLEHCFPYSRDCLYARSRKQS